jgi:hypothetical protein
MVMKTQALVNLRTYWEELRKGRVAPFRAELDPRRFEDALEHMFILEQLSPTQVRTRLAGMALCEMMGMEVRGMPPEAFISAGDRAGFTELLQAVLSTPSVMELDLAAEDTMGNPVAAQMLLLPLRSDFGEVTRILGCVVTEKQNIKSPVNFAVISHRETIVQTLVEEHRDPTPPMPGFTETRRVFIGKDSPPLRAIDGDGAETTAPRRGHLRLVSGD